MISEGWRESKTSSWSRRNETWQLLILHPGLMLYQHLRLNKLHSMIRNETIRGWLINVLSFPRLLFLLKSLAHHLLVKAVPLTTFIRQFSCSPNPQASSSDPSEDTGKQLQNVIVGILNLHLYTPYHTSPDHCAIDWAIEATHTMPTALILIADGTEEIEFVTPYDGTQHPTISSATPHSSS